MSLGGDGCTVCTLTIAKAHTSTTAHTFLFMLDHCPMWCGTMMCPSATYWSLLRSPWLAGDWDEMEHQTLDPLPVPLKGLHER